MNKLCNFRLLNKNIYCYRNIRFLLSGIGDKRYFSVLPDSHETKQKKTTKQPSYLDILLDDIPSAWNSTQTEDKSDTTSAFKAWIADRKLSDQDGKMLNRLKDHIMNGGHPDFPRLPIKDGPHDDKRLKHWTDDYYTSIDTECFQWLKKQKKLYRNKTIHPWLHWKLLQLNVILQWTREPLQDRDFRWIGYHDDVLNNEKTAGVVAESDPLFPLHSQEQPLLKFLNPFYELWYESMPPTLKQLRLMNANQESKQSFSDMDDIRATRIIKKWNTELNEYRYYIGPKDIDQQKIDEEILYNQKQQTSDIIETTDNEQKSEHIETNDSEQNVDDLETNIEVKSENIETYNAEDKSEDIETNDSEQKSEDIETHDSEQNTDDLETDIEVKSGNIDTDNAEDKSESTESTRTLRSSYLSKDIYDKNSYSESELQTFFKDAPLKNADEVPIEAMTYLRKRETLKELKVSFTTASPKPMYSRRQRAEYFVEALKRELIEAEHLDLKELILIIRHLGLEYHPKQNPNAKKMNGWVPYSSPMTRKEATTKWKDWNGNKPVELYEYKPQRYTDINGVFSELDVYYKTRHPGQPPWGVWDIPEPNFDVEYFQIKVKSYLKCWRESFEGKRFIEENLKRKYDENKRRDVELKNRLMTGVELLLGERERKLEQINHNKQFRYKFGKDPEWEIKTRCKEKTLEIQKLQEECSQMDEIITNVHIYHDI